MRLLLDEHLPVRFGAKLIGHSVSTIRGEGWAGTKNGELLVKAIKAGFEVLLTNDSSIEFQQDVAKLSIGLVVLGAKSNKIEDLDPLVPLALSAIASVRPGEVRHVTR